MPRDSSTCSRTYPPVQHRSALRDGETIATNIATNVTAGALANVYGGNVVQNTVQEMPPNREPSIHVFRSSEDPPSASEAHIPRPPNMFILFRRAMLRELENQLIACDKSALVVQMWRDLSPEERKYWEELANAEKVKHAQMYPGYKFKPGHKGSKEGEQSDRKGKQRTTQGGVVKRVDEMAALGRSVSSGLMQSQATTQSKPVELPGNRYYVKQGDRAYNHQQSIAMPRLPTSYVPPPAPASRKEQATAPIAPSTFLPSTPFCPGSSSNSPANSGRRLHMDQPLRPDSLLLQGFSYKRPARKTATTQSNRTASATNNSSSSSFTTSTRNNGARLPSAISGIEQLGNAQSRNNDSNHTADDFWSLIANETGRHGNGDGFAPAFGGEQLMRTPNMLGVNGFSSVFDNHDIIAEAPPTVRTTQQFIVPSEPWRGSVTPRAPMGAHSSNSSSSRSG